MSDGRSLISAVGATLTLPALTSGGVARGEGPVFGADSCTFATAGDGERIAAAFAVGDTRLLPVVLVERTKVLPTATTAAREVAHQRSFAGRRCTWWLRRRSHVTRGWTFHHVAIGTQQRLASSELGQISTDEDRSTTNLRATLSSERASVEGSCVASARTVTSWQSLAKAADVSDESHVPYAYSSLRSRRGAKHRFNVRR